MSISKKYREIYDEKIIQLNNGIIMTYDTLEDRFFFKPFSHGSEDNSIEQLGKLMRKNLIFYCFGEQEILEYHEKNRLDNLEHAAIFAYESRSPKRNSNKDGLPGEILLDLLVQIYDRNAYKLTVRHLHRSDDKNEIKGYDLTYFVKSDNNISIWLGQSKMGRKLYCKNGIRHDLSKKYEGKYLAKQLFFVSDKPTPTTEESKEILEIINQINFEMCVADECERLDGLMKCFQKNNISIKIPCLLAYEESDVYSEPGAIREKIYEQMADIRSYFQKCEFEFEGFDAQIIFYIFPLKDLSKLRSTEGGFYEGLRK